MFPQAALLNYFLEYLFKVPLKVKFVSSLFKSYSFMLNFEITQVTCVSYLLRYLFHFHLLVTVQSTSNNYLSKLPFRVTVSSYLLKLPFTFLSYLLKLLELPFHVMFLSHLFILSFQVTFERYLLKLPR